MSKSKRIQNFVLGLIVIIAGIILVLSPDNGYKVIDIMFGIAFAGVGIRNLVFYFTLARYMTGGMMALFQGCIFADLGLFAFSIVNMEKSHVMLFLMIGFVVAGVYDVISASTLKKISSPIWRIRLFQGIICSVLPLISIVFFSTSEIAVYMYAVSILYRGVGTLLSAFRRMAIVYVSE